MKRVAVVKLPPSSWQPRYGLLAICRPERVFMTPHLRTRFVRGAMNTVRRVAALRWPWIRPSMGRPPAVRRAHRCPPLAKDKESP